MSEKGEEIVRGTQSNWKGRIRMVDTPCVSTFPDNLGEITQPSMLGSAQITSTRTRTVWRPRFSAAAVAPQLAAAGLVMVDLSTRN